jgi:hypothetical protein
MRIDNAKKGGFRILDRLFIQVLFHWNNHRAAECYVPVRYEW